MLSNRHAATPKAFVPFLPRKRPLTTSQKRTNSRLPRCIPTANCPKPCLPLSIEPVSKVERQDMTVEAWLEEHHKWKERQKVGLLQGHLVTVDSFQQVAGDLTQGMSLVELSFEAPLTSARRRRASLGLVQRKTLPIRRFPASKQFTRAIETTKVPIQIRTQLDSQDSLYEDPHTHRLAAYIRVPSPRRVPATAAGSTYSTASKFHTAGNLESPRFAPRSVQHRRPGRAPDTPDQWSRSNSPLESRYPAK